MKRVLLFGRPAVIVTVLGLVGVWAGCGGSGDDPPAVGTSTTSTPTQASPGTTTSMPATTATTTPPGPTVVAVSYRGGSVTGEMRPTVGLGDRVTIRVTSDVADKVHLHGYDKLVNVEPGRPASLNFIADVPGIFEVELESGHVKLMDLVVR